MSLQNLIALQAKKKESESQAAAKPSQPQQAESQPVAEPTEGNTSAATPAAANKPKGLGLNVVGKAGFTPTPKSALPTKTPATAKPKPAAPAQLEGGFSLEDLAGLDASSIEVAERNQDASGFDDEIEATAPDRVLDPDLTAEQLAFVESLDGIYQVLHDPEMFGQAVRMVMLELQENNEYDKLLADSDIHVMIRGMRRTMGLARVRKQEKSRKASTNKNARTKSALADKDMALLNMLMGDDDD
jgi:hypothetical protein